VLSIPCVKWEKKLSPPQERQKLLSIGTQTKTNTTRAYIPRH
jgi:hypothetical protein